MRGGQRVSAHANVWIAGTVMLTDCVAKLYGDDADRVVRLPSPRLRGPRRGLVNAASQGAPGRRAASLYHQSLPIYGELVPAESSSPRERSAPSASVKIYTRSSSKIGSETAHSQAAMSTGSSSLSVTCMTILLPT